MRASKFCFVAVFAGLFSSSVVAQTEAVPTAVGTAYDRDSGYLLYTEYHFCADDAAICTVQYRDTSGAMIAQKTLDYRDSLVSPALTLKDFRQDVDVSLAANRQDDAIVDAGFDNYVRSIWDQLDSGESVRFPFLVAGLEKPINMRADRETSAGCLQDELCLEVSLDSWFLGMLVSPIELVYSRESRKLLRFSGVSNIKSEEGDSQNVDIHYRYDGHLLLVGPLEQHKASFNL